MPAGQPHLEILAPNSKLSESYGSTQGPNDNFQRVP